MKRVLLLSAYHAPSHARWCQGLINYFSQWHWQLESLPARYFSWRTRGNSLTWGLGDFPALAKHYDLLVATSMVDLATLKGLLPNLAATPSLVYFHENQFAYPQTAQQQGLLEIQLTSIYTALAANHTLFNSHYNRNSFLDGAAGLLAKMPDGVPGGAVNKLQSNSSVIPVPLDDELFPGQQTLWSGGQVHLLWNHRWEWDKGPDLLLMMAQALADQGLLGRKYVLHVVGQQFRKLPGEFETLKSLLQQHNALGQWGFLPLAEYRTLLGRCHGVVSTARHDFQGLAVQEAALAGCLPLVPRRVVYPEWFGEDQCYPSLPADPQAEIAGLIQRMEHHFAAAGNGQPANNSDHSYLPAQLAWQQLGPRYGDAFAIG